MSTSLSASEWAPAPASREMVRKGRGSSDPVLECRDRAAEKLARLGECEGFGEAGLSRADGAPGDSIAGLTQAAQRPTHAERPGKHCTLGHPHIVEKELGCDRGTQ